MALKPGSSISGDELLVASNSSADVGSDATKKPMTTMLWPDEKR